MIVSSGNFKYKWIEDWVKIPEPESGSFSGRTHGVVITADNDVIIFHQANPAVLVYDKNGNLLNSWGKYSGAHGMTLVKNNGTEYLWLTDEFSGEVIKTDLSGNTGMIITKPDTEIYNNLKYSPTWVAEFEEDKGGNGDIWVADGYGSGLINTYNRNGKYLKSLTGEEGAGRFDCPHSLFFSYRNNEPEVYIADRGNKRFQVYSSEGKYKRFFGITFFGCPCGGVEKDGLLYVPELCARLAILDERDNLICYLGQNEKTCEIPGWPDHPKDLIKAGLFNSPHHLAVDNDNNIYVVEWIKGGRISKLERI